MSNAPAARLAGDEHQAIVFWEEACRLMHPKTPVRRVDYEEGDLRAFEDVTVHYNQPVDDNVGGHVLRDAHQVKFNVDGTGEVTAAALADPEFIHAARHSILKRLAEGARKSDNAGVPTRFILHTPRRIDPEDILAKIYWRDAAALHIDELFAASAGSKLGKTRMMWMDAMGVTDTQEAQRILKRFRIHEAPGTTPQARRSLDQALVAAGFVPLDARSPENRYAGLITGLYRQHVRAFTRDELLARVKEAGLWVGVATPEPAVVLGIRSFVRRAEHLEDETDALLALEHHFDHRRLRAPATWTSTVQPEVREFLAKHARSEGRYVLHLASHASIAFAVGYELDTKSGVNVGIAQRGLAGTSIWRGDDAVPTDAPAPGTRFETLRAGEPDLAMCFALSQPALDDVKAYVAASLPNVGRILVVDTDATSGQRSVAGGGHAVKIVEAAVRVLRSERTNTERLTTTHVFFAAPNAIPFFLGQQARGLGRMTLYEHDFEAGGPRYEPSITIP